MNRKKAGMIAAAVMLPVTILAGSVAFFFHYAVVRVEKKKKTNKQKKAAAAPKEGEGLSFDCFRDKMEEGVRWFKEQDPEKITLTSYDGLKLSAYLLPAEKESRNTLPFCLGTATGVTVIRISPACTGSITNRDIICWYPIREAMRTAKENISALG